MNMQPTTIRQIVVEDAVTFITVELIFVAQLPVTQYIFENVM